MKIRLSVTALALLSFTSAQAFCFTEAANRYGVNEQLLIAIAKVESNYNPEALNPTSHALGVMQILPANFKSIQKYNITEPDLHQACTNINVGAWILAGFIKQYGPVWRAIGAYGVGNGKSEKVEAQRAIYAGKVERALAQLKKTPFNPNSVGSVSTKPTMQVIE